MLNWESLCHLFHIFYLSKFTISNIIDGNFHWTVTHIWFSVAWHSVSVCCSNIGNWASLITHSWNVSPRTTWASSPTWNLLCSCMFSHLFQRGSLLLVSSTENVVSRGKTLCGLLMYALIQMIIGKRGKDCVHKLKDYNSDTLPHKS